MSNVISKSDTKLDVAGFGTPEEERDDERIWEIQFSSTPPDKLNKLATKVRTKIQEGKTSPLDFTDK